MPIKLQLRKLSNRQHSLTILIKEVLMKISKQSILLIKFLVMIRKEQHTIG
jgi:hypothetical protein